MCLGDRPGVVPTGLDSIFVAIDPTLKRGANKRCASGAIEIGTRLVNKMDSCDCPGEVESDVPSAWETETLRAWAVSAKMGELPLTSTETARC